MPVAMPVPSPLSLRMVTLDAQQKSNRRQLVRSLVVHIDSNVVDAAQK